MYLCVELVSDRCLSLAFSLSQCVLFSFFSAIMVNYVICLLAKKLLAQ